MNICIVTQQLRDIFSGVGLYAKNLINYLVNEGHEVTVIVPKKQALSKECSFRIVTVRDVKYFNSQVRWVFLSKQFSKAIKILEKNQTFDFIHFTDVRDSFLCKSKSPQIANMNDTYSAELHNLNYYRKNYFDWFKRFVYYKLMHIIENRKLPELDQVVANSKFTYKTIEKNYSLSSSKLTMCYKSVDISRYKGLHKKRVNINKLDSFEILFVGGNMQRKGIIDLIKSAPFVIDKFPNTMFIIIGHDKFIPKYKDICRKLNIENQFNFLGWVSQDGLLEYYRDATIFVMPSLTEALGVVFLEAMAAGVPVIGTNVGGIPELINHKKNGLLVSINSSVELANAICFLLGDPVARQSFSINGLNTVKLFSVEKMMLCTNKIYSRYSRDENL